MRIAIITNVIPVYRKVFYEKLFQSEGFEIKVYCMSNIKGMNLKLCHDEFPKQIKIVNAWDLGKERLVWQFLPVRELIKENDIFIFYANPRLITNVIWSSEKIYDTFSLRDIVCSQHNGLVTQVFQQTFLLSCLCPLLLHLVEYIHSL